MGGFVDPQFVDLLLSLEDYKLFRGQLEGIRFAIREIKEIAERTFTDDI